MDKFYRNAIKLALAVERGWDFTDKVEEIFQFNELDVCERLGFLLDLRGCVPTFCTKELEKLISEAEEELPEEEAESWGEYLRELREEDRRHGLLD